MRYVCVICVSGGSFSLYLTVWMLPLHTDGGYPSDLQRCLVLHARIVRMARGEVEVEGYFRAWRDFLKGMCSPHRLFFLNESHPRPHTPLSHPRTYLNLAPIPSLNTLVLITPSSLSHPHSYPHTHILGSLPLPFVTVPCQPTCRSLGCRRLRGAMLTSGTATCVASTQETYFAWMRLLNMTGMVLCVSMGWHGMVWDEMGWYVAIGAGI